MRAGGRLVLVHSGRLTLGLRDARNRPEAALSAPITYRRGRGRWSPDAVVSPSAIGRSVASIASTARPARRGPARSWRHSRCEPGVALGGARYRGHHERREGEAGADVRHDHRRQDVDRVGAFDRRPDRRSCALRSRPARAALKAARPSTGVRVAPPAWGSRSSPKRRPSQSSSSCSRWHAFGGCVGMSWFGEPCGRR
jgi:hypothetical protein